MNGSWRTTLLGWLAIGVGVAQLAINFLDGNPETTASWEQLMVLFGFGAAGAGLIQAKDDK